MVVETWVIPIVIVLSMGGNKEDGALPKFIKLPTRLLRLLRLARMGRLVRHLPELMQMIKGVKEASRAVLSALLMLVILIYSFAVMLQYVLDERQAVGEHFIGLKSVMWTLLIDGTFLDSIGTV